MIAPLTGTLTGGSTIISYLIEYDGATNGLTWYEI